MKNLGLLSNVIGGHYQNTFGKISKHFITCFNEGI